MAAVSLWMTAMTLSQLPANLRLRASTIVVDGRLCGERRVGRRAEHYYCWSYRGVDYEKLEHAPEAPVPPDLQRVDDDTIVHLRLDPSDARCAVTAGRDVMREWTFAFVFALVFLAAWGSAFLVFLLRMRAVRRKS